MKEFVLAIIDQSSPFFFQMVIAMIFFVCMQLFINNRALIEELFLYVCILLVIPEVTSIFKIVQEVSTILTSMLMAFAPIVGSILLVLQGPVSALAWNPIVLAIIQFIVWISEQLLIPCLCLALFLDTWSRVMVEMPLTKLASSIRGFLLITIGVSMLVLTSVMTIGGGLIFSLNDSVTAPIKKTLEQSIPFIGSVIVQAISVIKKTQVVSSGVIGATAIISFVSALSLPLILLLFKAFLFKLLSIISEPLLPGRISGLFDDISKNLFVLCGVVAILFVSVVMIILLLIAMFTLFFGRG